MAKKLRTFLREFRLSLRMKLILSLCSIAFILLVSCVISVMEYSSMSDYVSELIADNIRSINAAQRLAGSVSSYDLSILAIVGEEDAAGMPDFNQAEFVSHCDSLHNDLDASQMSHLADSVMYAYSAFMLISLELPDVLQSDFIDSRGWYFGRLQPVYSQLYAYIEAMSGVIYEQLQNNSATFERGFYRSVIPGAVAVAVGILLVFLLLFFILAYYVNPICRILKGLEAYRADNRDYKYDFDGDDQLHELNDGIRELIGENRQLRSRIKGLRSRLKERGM